MPKRFIFGLLAAALLLCGVFLFARGTALVYDNHEVPPSSAELIAEQPVSGYVGMAMMLVGVLLLPFSVFFK